MTPRSRRYFIGKKQYRFIMTIIGNGFMRAQLFAEMSRPPQPTYPRGGTMSASPQLFGEIERGHEVIMPRSANVIHPIVVGADIHNGTPVYGYPIMNDGCIIGQLKEAIKDSLISDLPHDPPPKQHKVHSR